jgi:hypothetical protein
LIVQLATAEVLFYQDGPYLVSFDFFNNIDGKTDSYITIGGFNSTWTYGGNLNSMVNFMIEE